MSFVALKISGTSSTSGETSLNCYLVHQRRILNCVCPKKFSSINSNNSSNNNNDDDDDVDDYDKLKIILITKSLKAIHSV